jgi:hypothetical protein
MFTFKPEISHNAQNQLKKVLKWKGITQGDGTVLVGVHIRINQPNDPTVIIVWLVSERVAMSTGAEFPSRIIVSLPLSSIVFAHDTLFVATINNTDNRLL